MARPHCQRPRGGEKLPKPNRSDPRLLPASELVKRGIEIAVVTSGAVAIGRWKLMLGAQGIDIELAALVGWGVLAR